jgi:tetratricopeptide (TPR) repeat protein
MARNVLHLTVLLLGVLASSVTALRGADRDVKPLPDAKTDPVEQEFTKLLEADDSAQEEVDRWIRDNEGFARAGAGARPEAMRARIRERLDKVRQAYEDFCRRHPDHARAHLAFGSFLNDINEEEEAEKHWERARELNPNDPAPWNNLANLFGHSGPVAMAFAYYEKAIALNSNEPVYYQNLATTVYLFRKDAMEYYKCNETQVFDRSLDLYKKAVQLAPDDFPLATDYAQTYYGIRPMRTNDALVAWTNALAIARDEIEREGVHIHFARIKMNAGRFEEARQHLKVITNAMYDTIKSRLLRNLAEKESGTNVPPKAPSPEAPKGAAEDVLRPAQPAEPAPR